MRATASVLCLFATISSFPKGISAKKTTEDICESFSGLDAASNAVTWCSSPDRTTKCCTNDAGDVSPDACNNWGSNAEYNLCEGSCQGTNSCVSMLTNAAPGSSISIKEGGCAEGLEDCKDFASNPGGVVTASIGKGACSNGGCTGFLNEASGHIDVDIQDAACQGGCRDAFKSAGSGSSIVIKKGGCVGNRACSRFAEEADGAVTGCIYREESLFGRKLFR